MGILRAMLAGSDEEPDNDETPETERQKAVDEALDRLIAERAHAPARTPIAATFSAIAVKNSASTPQIADGQAASKPAIDRPRSSLPAFGRKRLV